MAITFTLYGELSLTLPNKEIALTDGNVKLSLHTNSYSPNKDTDKYFSSATNEVTNGSGYTTGGVALSNPTLTYVAGTHTGTFDADDAAWLALTKTFRYAVLRYDTGNSATSALIGWVDFGADVNISNQNFTVVWDASGIFNMVM